MSSKRLPFPASIAVFGAGAWGTAFAIGLTRELGADSGESNPETPQVTLFCRNHFAELTRDRENRRYLPGVPFPPKLALSSDFSACAGADLRLIATPMSAFSEVFTQLIRFSPQPIVWLAKGLAQGRLACEEAERLAVGKDLTWGVLTGPSFAQEVANGQPCALVLALNRGDSIQSLQPVLNTSTMRVYAGEDVLGSCIGGAVKNVLAIAAGISDGLGLGANARAALITRGLAELIRFGKALGARSETLMGLSGLGDLILTCTGKLSRNHTVGFLLAQGKSLKNILAELGHVSEGVYSTEQIVARARSLGVDLPISFAVDEVIAGRLDPRSALQRLMARGVGRER